MRPRGCGAGAGQREVSGRLSAHRCQLPFAKNLKKGSFVTNPQDVKYEQVFSPRSY